MRRPRGELILGRPRRLPLYRLVRLHWPVPHWARLHRLLRRIGLAWRTLLAVPAGAGLRIPAGRGARARRCVRSCPAVRARRRAGSSRPPCAAGRRLAGRGQHRGLSGVRTACIRIARAGVRHACIGLARVRLTGVRPGGLPLALVRLALIGTVAGPGAHEIAVRQARRAGTAGGHPGGRRDSRAGTAGGARASNRGACSRWRARRNPRRHRRGPRPHDRQPGPVRRPPARPPGCRAARTPRRQ